MSCKVFSPLVLTTLLLAAGCSHHSKPYDIKGTWRATSDPCFDVCQFTVRDNLDEKRPSKLFITFLNWKGGDNPDHAFEQTTTPGKTDEWSFPHSQGTGYLYLQGNTFEATSGLTYKKVEETKK